MLIDFHHHVVFDAYRAALERSGDGTVGGVPLPPWDEASMLARLDELAIDRAIVSVSTPAVVPVPAGDRAALARDCNDEAAALVAAHPERLGAFAVLPLPDVDAALAELDRVALDGVTLLTNYEGRYLGHESLRPLLEELDRRAALVHVHPNLPPPMAAAGLVLPAPVLEFTFDTTRAFADLIATGTLERYPRIRFVLSHLGGTLPFLAWRLSVLDAFTDRPPALEQMRRLWFDVAASGAPANLRFAIDVLGADRLVYGSDTPFAPAPFVDANTAGLDALDEAERVAIQHANAEALLRA